MLPQAAKVVAALNIRQKGTTLGHRELQASSSSSRRASLPFLVSLSDLHSQIFLRSLIDYCPSQRIRGTSRALRPPLGLMAPQRRNLLAKERFSFAFGSLRTQSYLDPAAKGPGTHTYVPAPKHCRASNKAHAHRNVSESAQLHGILPANWSLRGPTTAPFGSGIRSARSGDTLPNCAGIPEGLRRFSSTRLATRSSRAAPVMARSGYGTYAQRRA